MNRDVNYRIYITLACCWKRSRWTKGSFNSVYAFTTSFPAMNNSKRSVRPFVDLWYFDSGLMTSGWSVM